MSYCRWSSDNFRCDLYCFHHVGGYFVTYVANARQREWLHFFHWLTDRRLRAHGRTFRFTRFAMWKWPHWLTHKRIGLPQDGREFQDNTEAEMFATIKWLHSLGYSVPKDLLEEGPQIEIFRQDAQKHTGTADSTGHGQPL